jgi:hypothetical protein
VLRELLLELLELELLGSISFTSSLIRLVKFHKLTDKKLYRINISTLLSSNEKLIFAYKQMKFHEYSLPASMLSSR